MCLVFFSLAASAIGPHQPVCSLPIPRVRRGSLYQPRHANDPAPEHEDRCLTGYIPPTDTAQLQGKTPAGPGIRGYFPREAV